MKIWLIGMMGSGKSSAGALAAAGLGVDFMDTDEIVADRAGTSIKQLWSDEGEGAFREREKVVVTDLETSDGIVATGGGVVLDEANRTTMRRSGLVVWLEASPPVLVERIGDGADRPLVEADADLLGVLTRILTERKALYRETADHRIVTDHLDLAAISNRIEDLWKS